MKVKQLIQIIIVVCIIALFLFVPCFVGLVYNLEHIVLTWIAGLYTAVALLLIGMLLTVSIMWLYRQSAKWSLRLIKKYNELISRRKG